MNSELIKELALRSYITVGDYSYCETVLDPTKFAELIVNECAEQIIAKGTDWIDFAPSQTGVRPEYWDMAQQIKQHFGVNDETIWLCLGNSRNL